MEGIYIVAAVPDFDNLAIIESKYVNYRNLPASAHDAKQNRGRFHLPLPSGCHQISFSNLVIDTARHFAL